MKQCPGLTYKQLKKTDHYCSNTSSSGKQSPFNKHAGFLMSESDHSKILMTQATECVKQRNYPRAIELLEEILNSDPTNQFAISKLIQTFSRTRQVEDAEWEYKNAKELDVANIIIHNAMIDCYAKNGRIDKAREIYDELVLGNKADVFSHNAVMNYYAKNGQTKEVDAIYNKLGNNANIISHSTKLNAYAKDGQFDEAKRIYDKYWLGSNDNRQAIRLCQEWMDYQRRRRL